VTIAGDVPIGIDGGRSFIRKKEPSRSSATAAAAG
jgi:hypothetical protein